MRRLNELQLTAEQALDYEPKDGSHVTKDVGILRHRVLMPTGVGAGIGSIIGTFVFPGVGALMGAAIGALTSGTISFITRPRPKKRVSFSEQVETCDEAGVRLFIAPTKQKTATMSLQGKSTTPSSMEQPLPSVAIRAVNNNDSQDAPNSHESAVQYPGGFFQPYVPAQPRSATVSNPLPQGLLYGQISV
ncbi:MAG: DUF456 domain-containing protein [Legionellales bacterium]